ncbi:MAG: hypothetical protein WA952_08505, partial [Lewinella sp.]
RYLYRSVTAAESEQLRSNRRDKDLGPRKGKGKKVTDRFAHVTNAGAPSDYSSATTIEDDIGNRVTGEPFNKAGKIKIDLLHIDPGNLFPLTTPKERSRYGFSESGSSAKDAHATREVLIKADVKSGVAIPKAAIVEFWTVNGTLVHID